MEQSASRPQTSVNELTQTVAENVLFHSGTKTAQYDRVYLCSLEIPLLAYSC